MHTHGSEARLCGLSPLPLADSVALGKLLTPLGPLPLPGRWAMSRCTRVTRTEGLGVCDVTVRTVLRHS